ncbi:hypothetical protein Angca_004500 [Angiostrongylus cantonensis]|nr:hypothetical protein Angca_004500 [Angiostrongylus cantonensis]
MVIVLGPAQPVRTGCSSIKPLIGVLNLCPGKRWKWFHAGMDLFRHELMHSLGFGTVLPVSSYQKSPANVLYNWTTSWDQSSQQLAKRRFLDFAANAVKEARKHFGCPSLVGIEADSVDKIHLNEYIFANELMTPFLSNVSNRFSYISAAILEETYFGER